MKKSFVATVALLGLLSTSALAYKGECPKKGYNQDGAKAQMMHKKMYKAHKGMQKKGAMGMFANLDLSDEQKYEISILKDEMKLEMKKLRGPGQRGAKMSSFISEDGFDKDAYMSAHSEKHEQMLKIRADHMEKVFKVLSPEQLKKLQSASKS